MDLKPDLIEAIVSQLRENLTDEEQRQLRTALEKSLTVGQVEVKKVEVVEVENDRIEWPNCVFAHQDGSPMLVNVAGVEAKPDGFASFRSEEDAIAFKMAGSLCDEWRMVRTDRGLLRFLCKQASKMGLEYMMIYRMENKKISGFAIRLNDAVKLLREE
jgi:hypothetical protein